VQGLGKTVQTVAFCSALLGKTGGEGDRTAQPLPEGHAGRFFARVRAGGGVQVGLRGGRGGSCRRACTGVRGLGTAETGGGASVFSTS